MLRIKKEKENLPPTVHYFIDESGSPEFYGKGNKLLVGNKGYYPLLIIDVASIIDKKKAHRCIETFKEELLEDADLKDIYSLHQPNWYLHACKDHPQVRDRFFNLLLTLSFKCYIIIGRKKIDIFHKLHNKSENRFYFDLIHHLLKDRFKDFKKHKIFLSRRLGNSQEAIDEAIEKSIANYNKHTKKEDIQPNYVCSIINSKDSPELSIIDYMMWALQRYIMKGDDQYYRLLIDKYSYIYDPYDKKKQKNNKHYTPRNPFDLEKAGKFE